MDTRARNLAAAKVNYSGPMSSRCIAVMQEVKSQNEQKIRGISAEIQRVLHALAGGCGACTIMISSWEDGAICHKAVNACLCPIYSVEGMHVVTVEGTFFVQGCRQLSSSMIPMVHCFVESSLGHHCAKVCLSPCRTAA